MLTFSKYNEGVRRLAYKDELRMMIKFIHLEESSFFHLGLGLDSHLEPPVDICTYVGVDSWNMPPVHNPQRN